MEVCRICLATDRRMYPFDNNRIHLFQQVTGLTFVPEDLLPKSICWECKYYMLKYNAFRSKAVASQYILSELLAKDGYINPTSISIKPSLCCTEVLYLGFKGDDDDSSSESDEENFNDDDNDNISDSEDIKKSNEENNYTRFDPEVKMKVEPNYAFDYDVVTAKDEFDNDVDDSQGFNDETVSAENIIPSVNTDKVPSIKSSKKVDKKPVSIERKRKKIASKIKEEKSSKSSKAKRRKKVHKSLEEKPDKSNLEEVDKDIITISKLTMEEQIAELQSRKETDNYKNSPYKCENCFKGFVDDTTFGRHVEKHSESCGPCVCPLCKMRYSAPRHLNRHMKGHRYKFTCKKCSFSTNTLHVAMKHQNYHLGKKHVCPHCSEIYMHHTTLLYHIRHKHPSDAICQYCGSSFLGELGLTMHIKHVHRDQKPIPLDGPACARCDIRFSCQDALDTHRRVSAQHADERNSTRTRKPSMKRERPKTCTSEPFPDGPRTCEQCDEKLPNPRAYHIHFRKVHKDKNRTYFYKKRHMCEVCGKLFQSAAVLRSHQYVHSSTKQFKCDRCGKLFQLEANLYKHQTHHCGTRVDYPCAVCGKAFSSMSNRLRHMAIHKGLVYKCEMCDKVFNCPVNRKTHTEYVHNKKPWPKRNRGARRRERQVCRICLCTDRKVYHLDSNSIHFYEQITGLSFVSEDQLPKYVCWECGYYMSKYFDFKSRAVTSYCILTEIFNKNGVITESSLESANWNPYKSSLFRSDIVCLVVTEDEEIEEDLLVSNITIEAECDAGVFEKANNEFYNELTSVLASTDTEEEKEEERIENEESPKNESDNKKLRCNVSNRNSHIKYISEQIDKDFMAVTELRTLEEQIADFQMKKETANYKSCPYKCENCFRGFVDHMACKRHIAMHSESRGPHVCPVCKLRFRTRSKQKYHTKNSHSYKISCLKCTFTTKYYGVAIHHQNHHKGKTYECPHCYKVFGHETSYLSHLRIKHPSDTACEHCGYMFVNELGLKQHMRWNHRDVQEQVPSSGPVCARCDIRFSCQDALDTHRRVSAQHADERSAGIVKPQRNTKKTNRSYNRCTYIKGPFSCELCGDTLQSSMAYRAHFAKAHKGMTRTRYFYPRIAMCEICGKFFHNQFVLRDHMNTHSSTKQFKCDGCGKLFQRRTLLYTHRRHHCGTNRVKCPCEVCGKTFSRLANLQRHMGKHTGVQFKCQFCGKVFHCQGNMKAHIDYVHMKKPLPKRNRGRRIAAERQSKVMQSPADETEIDVQMLVQEE